MIGRSRKAEVLLADPGVSGVHACIEPRSGGAFVRDLGSRNGTFANGERVTSAGAALRSGEVLRVGDTLLLLVDDVELYRTRPRRVEAATLGIAEPVVAGPALARVWDEATRAAQLRHPVLLLGESGSGKECIARMLHAARAEGGPFVGINMAAVPDSLFEAELFGHERGAFTGARSARLGAFREATGGVLFLDEVGELNPPLQAKLLRTLDQRRVRPLGADREYEVNVQLVSATNRELKSASEDGNEAFRTDLYYRLAGIVIRVPPLRERPDDIILLTEQLLRAQRPQLKLSADVAELLVLGRWEGNARELRYAVVHATLAALASGSDELRAEHVKAPLPKAAGGGPLTAERMRAALAQCDGVATHAARALGVSRATFYVALKRFNLGSQKLARGSNLDGT
ncbi:MAG TPA: sigma 54-interacting transcriptional regulator [Polyangiaceae bacterium]|nr:sigma 54-interacting transcriptional regulator [Polyangiaceae bacterium]